MATRMTKPNKCEATTVDNGILMEEWKDILGYEGLYKVSNWGRIWSCRQNKILILHRCNQTMCI